MAARNAQLMTLVRAIVADDTATASRLLAASQALAVARAEEGASRQAAKDHYLVEIEHYLYAGDTALHIAAAAHRPEIIRLLIGMGADVGARIAVARSRFTTQSTACRARERGIRTWTTGRGGVGSPEAKAEQEEIVDLLQRHGATR
jgi:hypothetical protein